MLIVLQHRGATAGSVQNGIDLQSSEGFEIVFGQVGSLSRIAIVVVKGAAAGLLAGYMHAVTEPVEDADGGGEPALP